MSDVGLAVEEEGVATAAAAAAVARQRRVPRPQLQGAWSGVGV